MWKNFFSFISTWNHRRWIYDEIISKRIRKWYNFKMFFQLSLIYNRIVDPQIFLLEVRIYLIHFWYARNVHDWSTTDRVVSEIFDWIFFLKVFLAFFSKRWKHLIIFFIWKRKLTAELCKLNRKIKLKFNDSY